MIQMQLSNNQSHQALIELTLLKVARSMGIRNPPATGILSILSEFIIRYYGQFTTKEIEAAFDYGCSNGIEPYQSMDKMYVAKNLNLYKPIVQKRIDSENPLLLEQQWQQPTNKEYYEGMMMYCKNHGDIPQAWAWSQVFEYMTETNMIQVSEKEYKYVELMMIAERKAEIQTTSNISTLNITIKNMLDAVSGATVSQRTSRYFIKNNYEQRKNKTSNGD